MSTTTTSTKTRPSFESSEGLRELLNRLHRAGGGAWRFDPEAAALMRHAADRYAALARRHGLDPWEAAAAAFDAMRTRSVRLADDPWAVVTRAVQVTCIAEERANGLLCSVHQARRPRYSACHDAERFSDRENPLTDYHPAFQTPATDLEESDTDGSDGLSTGVESAVNDAVALFALLGWSESTARSAIEYICARLTEASSRGSGFETLRRDYHARALFDLPGASWMAMLRVVLGHPDPDLARTSAGRGILRRLLVGEPLRDLLHDEALLAEVALAAPEDPRPRHGH